MKMLEGIVRNHCTIPPELELHERGFVIALKGLYCRYENGEITMEQARHEKEVLVKLYQKQQKAQSERHLKLNKKAVVDTVILELGRYISCGTTNHDREKAYPRLLFEKRIVEVIDKAYGA